MHIRALPLGPIYGGICGTFVTSLMSHLLLKQLHEQARALALTASVVVSDEPQRPPTRALVQHSSCTVLETVQSPRLDAGQKECRSLVAEKVTRTSS